MRQINVVIFVVCFALVLFGIENTEPAVIHVEGVDVQAPLSIELLLAGSLGAVLAWVFSVWTQIQRSIELRSNLRQREVCIEELEQEVQPYKVELEQRLLPASESNSPAKAYAQ